MAEWREQLTAEQRFRLLEMEFQVLMKLADGPNERLEGLLTKLNNGSKPAPRRDEMGGGEAFRRAVDNDPQVKKAKGNSRFAGGKRSPEHTARMEELFRAGELSGKEIYGKLQEEFGPLPFCMGTVSFHKTKWGERQRAAEAAVEASGT